MRLIDADKLLEYIDIGHHRHPDELSYSEVDLVNMINNMPTAYDIREVIEKINDLAIEFETFGISSDYVELSHAIEIVKGGKK